jgi:hypothetical protein
LIKLEKKVTKNDFLEPYEKSKDEEISNNPDKKEEIEKEFEKYFSDLKNKLAEKQIYEKPAFQIV